MGALEVEFDGTLSAPIVLHDIEIELRQHADRHVVHALQIGALLIAGCKRTEIECRLELSGAEYKSAHDWLRDAVRATRRDD